MAPASPEPTRNAILEAATALFLEQGVAATALSQVAKRAGVTKSLIHHHFETKDKLWAAVKDRLMEEYAEVQQQMLQGKTFDLQLLLDSMSVYFKFLEKRPELVRLITMFCLESEALGDESFERQASVGEGLFRLGVQVIAQGQADGAIRRDLSPGFILATTLGIAENWFLKRPWNQHCADDIPRTAARANAWYGEQMTRFLRQALAPL
jgi:TetR/AcrR family transcriptional regulator